MFLEAKYTERELMFSCEELIKLTQNNFEEVKKFSNGAVSNFEIKNNIACCSIDLGGYLVKLSEKDILGKHKEVGLVVFYDV